MAAPLRLKAGDDITLHITAVGADGEAINLTGSTIIFAVFNSYGTEQFRKTSASGITVTGATTGNFDVQIDDTDTNGFDGLYDCEAEITDSSGKKVTVAGADLLPEKIYFIPDLIS